MSKSPEALGVWKEGLAILLNDARTDEGVAFHSPKEKRSLGKVLLSRVK